MPRPSGSYVPWLNVEGCGFVIVTALLLVMNAMVLHLLLVALARIPPLEAIVSNPKVHQAVQFVGSMVLVFLQWWLIELWTARWYYDRPEDKDPPA